jgi:hypothetical protein
MFEIAKSLLDRQALEEMASKLKAAKQFLFVQQSFS